MEMQKLAVMVLIELKIYITARMQQRLETVKSDIDYEIKLRSKPPGAPCAVAPCYPQPVARKEHEMIMGSSLVALADLYETLCSTMRNHPITDKGAIGAMKEKYKIAPEFEHFLNYLVDLKSNSDGAGNKPQVEAMMFSALHNLLKG